MWTDEHVFVEDKHAVLTGDMKKEILAEVAACGGKRMACIEAMKIVQRTRRWVNDEDLAEVAAMLDMTCDEIDGVATFYNLIRRRPVGRHVILVCTSVSCWMMGYGKLMERLRELLGVDFGQTTSDDRFTLIPNQCLGACDHAPALMIDDDLYHDVAPDALEGVLAKYE
jgi:NADH-quinone oxidoreductase subunit E